MNEPGSSAKRVFDVATSVASLLAAGPLIAVSALLVRLTSPGPVIYRKAVFGRGRRTVAMLKLRTMYVDAESRLKDMLRNDPGCTLEWEATQKLRRDPRITPVGRILRRFSIDELPQLWNVLRGDFSIVGPRPYFAEVHWYVGNQLRLFEDAADELLSERPGITSIWATSGRAMLAFEERIRLDLLYVRNRNLWMDLRVLAKTLWVVVRTDGAT